MVMKRGTYIGPLVRLEGEKALLMDDGKGWLAQFDNKLLPEAYGWRRFEYTDFEVDS